VLCVTTALLPLAGCTPAQKQTTLQIVTALRIIAELEAKTAKLENHITRAVAVGVRFEDEECFNDAATQLHEAWNLRVIDFPMVQSMLHYRDRMNTAEANVAQVEAERDAAKTNESEWKRKYEYSFRMAVNDGLSNQKERSELFERSESAEQELQKARVLMTRLVTLSVLGASRWPQVVINLAEEYLAFLATEGGEGMK
jgi:multidrug resistance efflux pump